MIFDHYIVVCSWQADFVSSEVTFNKTMVWILFPSPSMEYYDENVLTARISAIGKHVEWIFVLLMRHGGSLHVYM